MAQGPNELEATTRTDSHSVTSKAIACNTKVPWTKFGLTGLRHQSALRPPFAGPTGLCIRSFSVGVLCFCCFNLSQFAPRVVHAMRKGPIGANCKYPQD